MRSILIVLVPTYLVDAVTGYQNLRSLNRPNNYQRSRSNFYPSRNHFQTRNDRHLLYKQDHHNQNLQAGYLQNYPTHIRSQPPSFHHPPQPPKSIHHPMGQNSRKSRKEHRSVYRQHDGARSFNNKLTTPRNVVIQKSGRGMMTRRESPRNEIMTSMSRQLTIDLPHEKRLYTSSRPRVYSNFFETGDLKSLKIRNYQKKPSTSMKKKKPIKNKGK